MDRGKLPEYIFGFMPILRRRLLKRHPVCMMPKQQMNVLMHISFSEGKAMNHYGQVMAISRPNMTKIVDSLIKSGYVTRGHDEHDRRIVTLHITQSGRQVVDDHWNDLREQIIENTRVLSDDEMQALFDSFETIKKIFEKLDLNEEE